MNVLVPALTALLGLVFALALFDQWRERRGGFQLVWGVGMLFYGVAAACEAIGEAAGWNELLFRGWFAFGVATPAWLGLGTAFLLNRTRFGYTYGVLLAFGAFIGFVTRARYTDAGLVPVALLIAGLALALAIGIETYFANERWPRLAALGVVVATAAIVVLATPTGLQPGQLEAARTLSERSVFMPGAARVLTPVLTITGGLALVFGALFSTYVFMPKRRVLPYSLDPDQRGDEFLFNLVIAAVAIPVNLVASLPGAARAIVSGKIHSRVPATILIALGAFVPTWTDSFDQWAAAGRLVGVALLLVGFLVSIEVFREIRIPFTSIRLAAARRERAAASGAEAMRTDRSDREPASHAAE